MKKEKIFNTIVSLAIAIVGMVLISSCLSSEDRGHANKLYNDWRNYNDAVINAASR